LRAHIMGVVRNNYIQLKNKSLSKAVIVLD